MSFYVPTGNWTDLVVWNYIMQFFTNLETNIKNKVNFNSLSIENLLPTSINYLVNLDTNGRPNPAEGCPKNFTGSYQCGTSNTPVKNISVAAESLGQLANFDCSTESALCNNLKLILNDDGSLVLQTSNGATTIWSSVTNGSHPTIPAGTIIPASVTTNVKSNSPLTIVDYAGNGQPNSKVDVEAGGGPGRRYKDNYLLPGQFLELGQWIGSPSGTCRLIMGTPALPTALQVVTAITGGNSLDSTNAATIDDRAVRLYTIPSIYNTSKGKVGYIDNYGQLNVYPDTMTEYNNNFENVGNYSLPAGASLGPATQAADLATCKNLCATKGDTQQCAGFVFDSTTARCQLLNNSLYTQPRIIDPTTSTYQYYVRTKIAKGQDISCPTDSTVRNTSFWNSTPASSTNPTMSPTTKCGLAKFTENERTKVSNDLPSLTNDTVFQTMFMGLQGKYKQLTSTIFNTKTKIDTNFEELLDARKNLADWSGEKLQNLEAMNEDRDLNMMSQNYRHILWSILAIVIVIATLKISKTIASGTAAA